MKGTAVRHPTEGIRTPAVGRPSDTPSAITRLLPVLAVVASVFLDAGTAHAQLNKAYDDYYKPMQEYGSTLKRFADSDDSRREYDAVKSLSEKYVDRLERMADPVNSIGSRFADSQNRDWAGNVSRRTLSSIAKAKDKADAVRRKADSKSDAKSEIADLQQALTDLSDNFKDLWKSHEERRQKLIDETIAAREKWLNATKDDRKPLDEAQRLWGAAREREVAVTGKRNDAMRAYLSAIDANDRARSALFSGGTVTPDELKSRREAYSKSFDSMLAAKKSAMQLETEIAESGKVVQSALADVQKAWDAYEKQFRSGDSILATDLMAAHQRAAEFAAEYKQFSW